MPKVLDVKKIIKRNPQVDREKLNESLDLSKQLSKSGVAMSGYNLASPFSRRRIRKQKDTFVQTKRTGRYRKI